MTTIKNLRKSKNLTQKQLSEIIGIDQTAVSKWELDKALPDTSTAIKLSEYFDVSIDYLLGRSTYYYPDSVKQSNVPPLSPDEQEILTLYQSLTPARKEDLKIYLRALSESSAANTTKNKA